MEISILRYVSLDNYINSKTPFSLKEIIDWCSSNFGNSLAENLIVYIHDNNLNIPENMEKNFVVNSVPIKDFMERGMEEEYMKYMGYSLYCID